VTTQVATFQVVNNLGLFNTRWSAIALFTGTDIISIYIFLQFVRGIPGSLDEAARIDGASYLTIYRKIIFPLLKPAIATVTIIKGVAVYTEFYISFLYMPGGDLGVVSTSLFRFKGPLRHRLGGDLGRGDDHHHSDTDRVPRAAALHLQRVHVWSHQVNGDQ